MDCEKSNFSGLFRQKIKQRFSLSSKLTNSLNDSNQIYNGCFTRSKRIESRLNRIIFETKLPRFDDIVEHLRSRNKLLENNSDDLLPSFKSTNDDQSFSDFCDDNLDCLSIVHHVKQRKNSDKSSPIQNQEFLLREFLTLVSQLIGYTQKEISQCILENAAVYLLWIFYDSLIASTQNGDVQSTLVTFNYTIISSYFFILEYVFCLDRMNLTLLEQLCFIFRSLYELIDQQFLSEVFHFSSMIKKAVDDAEKQQETFNDWFQTLTDKFSYSENYVNPFELSDWNCIPITKTDLKITQDSSHDLTKLDCHYLNAEIIMQNFLFQGISIDMRSSVHSNNSFFNNEEKNVKPSNELEDCSPETLMSHLSSDLMYFISEYDISHEEPYYLSHEELFNAILNGLISSSDNDALSNELANLLGDNSLSLISKIILFYKPKMKSDSSFFTVEKTNSLLMKNKTLKNPELIWKMVSQARDTGSQFVRPSVIVQTSKEKALQKEMRKIDKKIQKSQKNFMTEDDGNQNEKLTLEDLQQMRNRNLKASIRAVFEPYVQERMREFQPSEKYPFVFDMLRSVQTTASYISETKIMLPVGFQRKEFRAHDEFVIPIMANTEQTKEFLKNFNQIKIDQTDEFCKRAFFGFSKLNIIQSTVFQTAYLSDNVNMLICAPTGAGKTNIAMLSILNILRQYSTDCTPETIALNQFKIIYIAPMKALCSEMTATFGKRLQSFGVKVRELTGDMQMTSKEIMETQMLVVTPEKWDIVTRKSVGDVQLMDLVRLIVIDEVHLLQSDRGPVLETLVARTIRFVEQAQKCIRLVGLSATLPNYVDVAQFLHVNPNQGLFVFDDRFRPVPLLKIFIGCKANNKNQLNADMDEITMNKARDKLIQDKQVMIFVHSRNATLQMATYLLERAQQKNSNEPSLHGVFMADFSKLSGSEKLISKAKYRNLNKFLLNGIGVHHAGMPRFERNIVERLFSSGVIKALVCTSTLAWGVNLPAHSVIIRGTEFYDPSVGHFVDIDMLDVLQIFGRAGRPQFDIEGEAIIVTNYSKVPFYLNMLTNQLPIESRFLKRLVDNLNAEIVLGTISNISEGVEWLKYTYAYIRMQKNPLEYGLPQIASINKDLIIDHLVGLIRSSAEQLDQAQMARYSPSNEGLLDSTHLGRISSHFYIQHETVIHFNECLREEMDFGHLLDVISRAHEFEQLKFREEEFEDLQKLRQNCFFLPKSELSNTHTKVNILMQSVINRSKTECPSLNSDLMYILQNTSRLTRGLFEYVLRRGWPLLTEKLLNITLMFEKQIWSFDTPLKQFESELSYEVLNKLSNLLPTITHHMLREMDGKEVLNLLKDVNVSRVIKFLPHIVVEASIKPITRTILTIYVDVTPDFIWNDKYHGKSAQVFWLMVTDTKNSHIYHTETCRLSKKQVLKKEVQRFVFTIPLLDADYFQDEYVIYSTFDYWLGTEESTPVFCSNVILPDKHLPNTKLLDLMPLPITAFQNELFESIYKITHFNPIQTQIFHTLYHTDQNVLLGAPTGSGKTIAAEIALFRVFCNNPEAKVVYIAPLKALVRERVDDWKEKIEKNIGKNIVELTGDITPDIRTINSADVIVTTPEKWDGVSRGWPSRKFVRQIALIIIDEIHLLGEERGPVLEVIVSRSNFISRRTSQKIRIVGLSTAIANAHDLALWLNIERVGLYNFSPSVRPVPIEVHVSGFSEKNYCPRMASMNKPTYRAIKKHSPNKPVIIFVSSRRQTRLTALDLISLVASDDHSDGFRFLHMNSQELDIFLEQIKDSYLKHTLRFGIGMHHAGLKESDRKIVEQLFAEQKIQILVTTATLAWGVNLPAHAVIVKGTEFFDGKKGRYVDFPITDVLQMIGRAGRPQFDTSAVAMLFVHDLKKEYYKKFLYEPFPVESHLLEVFPEHLNAEIMAGTVTNHQEAMEYLSSTYLYYRIIKNPSYYGVDLSEIHGLENTSHFEYALNSEVIKFLSTFIDQSVRILIENYCVSLKTTDYSESQYNGTRKLDSNEIFVSTALGKISAYYYLSYKTISFFQNIFSVAENSINDKKPPYFITSQLLDFLSKASEFSQLPVRHNEDLLNQKLVQSCPIKLIKHSMDSPHTKTNLLLQAHCSRLALPIVDYYTDLKMVLDQVIRIFQSMIDISSLNGSLSTTLNIINLQQCIMQASWQNTNFLVMLLDEVIEKSEDDSTDDSSHYSESHRKEWIIEKFNQLPPELSSIPYLLNIISINKNNAENVFKNIFLKFQIHSRFVDCIFKSVLNFPFIDVEEIAIKFININEIDFQSNEQVFIVDKKDSFIARQNLKWIDLKSETEYSVQCRLRKKKLLHGKKLANSKAFCPRFPKPKSESWYLVLGVQEDSELVAITRVPNIDVHSSIWSLKFQSPVVQDKPIRILYTLYLMSDCYIGLDQQYILPLQFNV